MIKLAKIKDDETKEVVLGYEGQSEHFLSVGFDYLNVKQSDIDSRWYISNYCPMKTLEQKQREANATRIASIKEELKEIDLKSIRALRASEEDRLSLLEQRAEILREEIKTIEEE